MTERRGLLIAGGGVVGTALAWTLTVRGAKDVTVVDLDLAGVYASSELNAGGARATWWQTVNVEPCRSRCGTRNRRQQDGNVEYPATV